MAVQLYHCLQRPPNSAKLDRVSLRAVKGQRKSSLSSCRCIASSEWRLLCLVPARLLGHTVKAGRRDSSGKPASCSQLGSNSDLRVFTVLASFAQKLMLSMQTGTIWMIQKISQALFGLHNCSSSGDCQGFCVCKERKRYSACNIGSGPVLDSTFHGPTSVVLDCMRVSS